MSAATNNIPPRSVLMRIMVRSWEYRRPRLAVRVRRSCAVFNVVLGVVLLGSVYWVGPLGALGLLPLAGAALLFWTAQNVQNSAHV
jgi:hypothetical protein